MFRSYLLTFTAVVLIAATAAMPPAQAEENRSPGTTIKANESPAIVGKWEWTLNIGPSSGKASMEVGLVKGILTAVVTAPDGTVLKSKDFTVKGNKVNFSIQHKRGFITVNIKHAGELNGDEIRGTFLAKGGIIKKEGKWQATRMKK